MHSVEEAAKQLPKEIKDTKEIAISESERKIILLTGDKLYSIEIKHLEE